MSLLRAFFQRLNRHQHCAGAEVELLDLAQVYELVRQLRGQAGQRQVERADTGLVQNAGIGGVNVLVLSR